MSKLAYVYVAQSVLHAVLPFCLGCVGINNVFTATDVLKLTSTQNVRKET